MGKTHIVQKFVRDHPSEFDAVTGATRTRVAAMQMPPEPLEKDFYDELLIAMGAVVSASSSIVSVRSRARTFARQFGLRLLIIDEIHAMLAGTFRQQRIFLNSIRFLANDLHLPLLCVGTQEAHQALLTDQQLADRFAAFELPRMAGRCRLRAVIEDIRGRFFRSACRPTCASRRSGNGFFR